MECLTLRATVYTVTDEMLSHNSANINMQVNNETLFLLADVAVSEAKSKSPNCSEDCSSLEMLAACLPLSLPQSKLRFEWYL